MVRPRTLVLSEVDREFLADMAFCTPMTQSGRRPHEVLGRAGALASDRAGSISFSLAEGAIGGDASAPVAAMICCWQESPSAMIRSNAPLAQF